MTQRSQSQKWYKRRLPWVGWAGVLNIVRPPLNRALLPIVCEVLPRTHRGFVWNPCRRTQNVVVLHRSIQFIVREFSPRTHRGFVWLPTLRQQNTVVFHRTKIVPRHKFLFPREQGTIIVVRAPHPPRIGARPVSVTPLVIHPGLRSTRGFVWRSLAYLITPQIKVRPLTAVVSNQPVQVAHRSRGIAARIRPPAPQPPVPQPPHRTYRLHASVATTLRLRGEVVTTLLLRASVKTTHFRRASDSMSVPSNFQFFQGEDVLLKFQLTPPQDMTGWSLMCSIKDKLGGTLQFNPAFIITDAGRGQFQASLPRSSTSALSPGDYVWDIRRTDSGANTVLAHGECTCKQPVTP
jgi:hypothetical protein